MAGRKQAARTEEAAPKTAESLSEPGRPRAVPGPDDTWSSEVVSVPAPVVDETDPAFVRTQAGKVGEVETQPGPTAAAAGVVTSSPTGAGAEASASGTASTGVPPTGST